MLRLHGHVQIEYTDEQGDQIESLDAVDPRNEEDRGFIHKVLDEYLDYLCKRLDSVERAIESGDMIPNENGTVVDVGNEINHFEVSDCIDKH